MEYYFEASEILADPETSPELQQIVRLKVENLNEAVSLAAQYEKTFPKEKGNLEIHEHDHKNAKPCKKIDLRPMLDNPDFVRGL